MKMTDGKRTIEIKLRCWNGSGWDPDWSQDFYDAGLLQYDETTNTFIVDDVDYCIETAKDWENKLGDFADDGYPDKEDRRVFITDL